MSLPLYLSAFRLSRTALLTWAVILLIYAVLLSYLYDSLNDLSGIQEAIEGLPLGLQEAIGTAGVDIDPFAGGVWDVRNYLNTEYMSWLPLMLGIYAVFYCGGIVSREAERGTLDLLLAQPLSRHSLILSKAAAFFTAIVLLLAVSWAGIAMGLSIIGVSVSLVNLAVAHAMILPFMLAAGGLSTLASVLYLDPRKSLALSGAIIAMMYLVNVIAPVIGGLQWMQNLSLFHHVDVLRTLLDGSMAWTGLVVNLGVATATFAAA